MVLFKKSLLLFFLFLFTANTYCLEWYQDYENGRKAIDKGKCSEGTALMLEALKKNPKPDNRARPYGMVTWEYVPHFYLAKCALENGDYDSAARYIKLAEQGGIYNSSKASEARQIRQQVDQKLQATSKPPVTRTPQGDTQSPGSASPSITTSVPAVKPTPSSSSQTQLIERTLKEAREAWRAGDYEEARSAANRVLMLDRNNAEASRLLNQITRKEEEERKANQKEKLLADARRALNSGQLLSAENMAIQLNSQYPNDPAVVSLVNEIQKQKQAQMQNMAAEEARKLVEKQVMIAYYSGKYEVVVHLAGQGLTQFPESWRLHFYEGCAYAALGFLNERKEENLSKARESFRKAKGITGITEPPQISPKILEVFRTS